MAVGATTAYLSTMPQNSNAFSPSHQQHQRIYPSSTTTTTTIHSSTVNPDWDNASYMDSLGGTSDDISNANDEYYKQSENRAAMTDWRVQKAIEDGSAPQLLQELQQQQQQGEQQNTRPSLELAQKKGGIGQGWRKEMQSEQQAVVPQQMQQPPPQSQQATQQQQFYDANGNPVSMPMVYDANGNLVPFNLPPQQPQQIQQQQSATTQPPQINQAESNSNTIQFEPNIPNALEPPLPTKTKGTDNPRPAGYNSDAYTMSNTADVYFAQLKQDSKVRKLARLSGDVTTANQVFASESVKQIADSWNSNPYTQEKNYQEARMEIEGTVRLQVGDGTDSEGGDGGSGGMSGTGQISYRDKLAQMKAKRGSGGGSVTQPKVQPPKVVQQPPPAQVAEVVPPKVESKVNVQPPPQVVVEQPRASKVDQTSNVGQYNSPPKLGAPVPAVQQQQQQTPPPQPAPTPEATDTYVPPKEQEDIDADAIAQGGGYGLASGTTNTYAIPGMEQMSAQEYRDKLQETISARQADRRKKSLQANDGVIGNRSSSGYLDGLKRKTAELNNPARVEQQSASPVVVNTTPAASTPPHTMPPRSEATPVPAQAATLVSTTGNEMNDPLAGSVACVEAALQMYKDSSPEDREAMMIPLREALLAATSASNKYMAEAELTAHKTAMEAGPSAVASTLESVAPAQPMMGFPTTYEVTKSDSESIPATTTLSNEKSTSLSDKEENDRKLKEVYEALTNAKGTEGKLGLKNMSGDEANALIDQIVTMRTVLLDELNSS